MKRQSFYSPRQLADLGLLASQPSEKTIRNMLRDGRLRATNLTKGTKRNTWGISQDEVNRFNQSVLAK